MRTNKILLSLLLSGLCLTVTQAQEFWFPNTPKDPNTTILRPGRTGIGIPTTSFNAFNTSTGRYTVADRVGFLVQGSNFTDVFNIGHLLTGDYGEEKVGDVWTSVGGPGSPGISGLPLYGTRHQFDRYSVNMALTDRNIITGASGMSGIRDAILFWDASSANDSRMYIGKTLGQGRISPDIVINPSGNVGIGTDSPSNRLDVEGNIGLPESASLFFNQSAQIRRDLSFARNNISFLFDNQTQFRVGADGITRIGDGGLRLRVSNNTSIVEGFFKNALSIALQTSGQITPRTAIRIEEINATGTPITISERTVTFGSNLAPQFGLEDIGSSSSPFDDIVARDFITISDGREKDEIRQLDRGLDHLIKLNPVSYQWKKQPEKGVKYGLIAQEVKEVVPEVVYDPEKEIEYDESGKALPVDPDARMGIAYNELIPLLIKSIQELNAKVQGQEKVIADLTAENGRTSAGELEESLDSPGGSSKLELLQNTPNPFDQSTTIRYYLPEGTQKAQLFVYNIDGQQVRSMELTETGEGAITITAGELGAGIYFYTLYADGEVSQTRKMILTE